MTISLADSPRSALTKALSLGRALGLWGGAAIYSFKFRIGCISFAMDLPPYFACPTAFLSLAGINELTCCFADGF